MIMKQIDLLYYIQNNLRNDFLDVFFVIITYLGGPVSLFLVLAVIYLLIKKRRYQGIDMLISMAMTAILVILVLKQLIDESRPCDIDTTINLLINRPYGQSMPSGHAALSACGVTCLFLYRDRFKYYGLVLGILICISRLYLFVHYPSDILVGILCGILCAFIGNYLTKKGNKFLKDKIIVKQKI